jgi:acyl-CoA hydrolase
MSEDTSDPGTATLGDSYTEMTELLLPNDTNVLGRALGGVVLNWMDICAAIAAGRFATERVVTASIDHVDFISPIDLGEIAVVEAYVFNTGETSMDVRVEVRAENPRTGEKRQTTTSFLTFVAIDEGGEPTSVPTLEHADENERALCDEAQAERRDQVEKLVERLEA